MNKEERQRRILKAIEEANGTQFIETWKLAEMLQVSEMTVRRDLQELAQRGLLQRQHGGAGPLPSQLTSTEDRRDKQIGILMVGRTGKYSDPFYNAVLEGADRRIHELGYRIAFINTRAELQTLADARALIESNPVRGLLMLGFNVESEIIDYLKSNVHALVCVAGTMWPALESIGLDGYNGIVEVVRHLFGLGYRRLGFITGNEGARRQGFIDSINSYGLPADPALCLTIPSGVDGWTPQLGLIGVARLMALPEPPDAIVCASDLIAIGVLQWLHEHKIRVPDDIAVTGFDNIKESEFTVPSLTTVHVHKQRIGALAAERAVKRIEDPDEVPLNILTPTNLVIRQSCGSRLQIARLA